MPKIDISDVREGMVLEKDVHNVNGQLLIPKGVQLSEKHTMLLKTWGVQQLEVKKVGGYGGNLDEAIQISEEDIQAMKKLFVGNEEKNPWMKHVYDLCLERRAFMAHKQNAE